MSVGVGVGVGVGDGFSTFASTSKHCQLFSPMKGFFLFFPPFFVIVTCFENTAIAQKLKQIRCPKKGTHLWQFSFEGCEVNLLSLMRVVP